jgi:uncharacterized protein with HEPN domain
VPHGILPRLVDIREAISGIEEVTAGATFETYAASWGMQRAVERGLEIISEASRHLPVDLKALAPEIPWRQIAAIGNLLRHEYQRADAMATWNIVREHLPRLAVATDRLIVETKRRETG